MSNKLTRFCTLILCISPAFYVQAAASLQPTDSESTEQLSKKETQLIAEKATQLISAVPLSEFEKAAILSPLTAHKANYKVFYGSIELGEAIYSLPATDTGYYTYHFDSNVSLLLLSDKRQLTSEFTLENGKLVPFRYVHERSGTGSDYTEQTAFAKAQEFIHTIYKQKALKLPYQERVFDPLMVQLQFRMDLAANTRPLDYKMVKEKEVDDYQFRVLGKEQVVLESGTYDTVKVEVVRAAKKAKKRQTYFWMAPDLAYLPVRLSHFSKGSKQLDIQLATYQFDQPLPPMTPIVIDGPATNASTSIDDLTAEADNDAQITESELDDIKQLAED
ncbi:DUF3108 domain-containing protein [Shewanella algicola]|uniref:DUF3108 domain-containing protein n=1 Tax=Shewanella algicola TaxID=640633 RepID=A0A9X1Z3A2_9GAMM|nr:DUF3108 domain-containing protein [Shewanella algicola]MCL1104310.1 DUF3108 domain-containing protein [Shewanella algicola]